MRRNSLNFSPLASFGKSVIVGNINLHGESHKIQSIFMLHNIPYFKTFTFHLNSSLQKTAILQSGI